MKRWRMGCFKLLFAMFLFVAGSCIAGATAVVALLNHYAQGLPDVAKLRYYEPSETTRIYSSDGKLIGTLFKENRTWTPYEKISPHLVHAILAVEDSRFYSHRGVDPVGVLRAAVYDLMHRGGAKQGASTITMQLARNLFLNPEQTMERKIKEMLLALQIEKKFTKDEILELYLNQIYFGGGAYGVQQAAKTYYNKNVSDLTLSEAALIAGLPQAPSTFSPLVSEHAAKMRQILVLGRMQDQRFLNWRDYRKALLEARHPTFVKNKQQEFQVLEVPYFTTFAIKQLYDRYDEDLLYRGGLKIYTTVDLRLQRAAEAAVRELVSAYGPGLNADSAALVCIENKTGYIKAMAGGLGWSKKNQFNRAWQARRHPGSSFKMFVYTAAMEAGYCPDTVVTDSPITIQVSATEQWQPKNSDGSYMGAINLKTALTQSRNVVAVKLLQMVGVERIIDLAYRMGVTEKLFPNPSLALGAVELSPMEMASAYSVLPNMGLKNVIQCVKTIHDTEGHLVEDNSFPKQEEVISEISAYMVIEMMKSVVTNGTGTMAQIPGVDVAGKTGTTDDYRDAWFCGYTPQFTCAVWVGNDNNSRMANSFGGNLPARIWHRFMSEAQKDQERVPFGLVQDGKVGVLMCKDSKQRATNTCIKTYRQFVVPGQVPGRFCAIHGRGGDALLPGVKRHGSSLPSGTGGEALPAPEDPLELPPDDLPTPAENETASPLEPAPDVIPAPPSGPAEPIPTPAAPAETPSEL